MTTISIFDDEKVLHTKKRIRKAIPHANMFHQGRSPLLSSCYWGPYDILAEGGHLMILKNQLSLVEMCINAFSTITVHLVHRSCILFTSKCQTHCRTWELARKSIVMQDSQGVLAVRMLPTSLLKEFHVESGRAILDTRCLVPQGPTI